VAVSFSQPTSSRRRRIGRSQRSLEGWSICSGQDLAYSADLSGFVFRPFEFEVHTSTYLGSGSGTLGEKSAEFRGITGCDPEPWRPTETLAHHKRERVDAEWPIVLMTRGGQHCHPFFFLRSQDPTRPAVSPMSGSKLPKRLVRFLCREPKNMA
jgi:hypothetical protein